MVHVYKEVKLQIMIWFTTSLMVGLDSSQVSVEFVLMTGQWHRFLSSASNFPCHYHSTIAPYQSIHLQLTLYNHIS